MAAAMTAPALADDDAVAANDMDAAISAEVAPPMVGHNRDVTIGATAAAPVVVESAGGDTASIALPVTGTASHTSTTAVFEGAARDTQVGIHATRDGFRALVRIESEGCPRAL